MGVASRRAISRSKRSAEIPARNPDTGGATAVRNPDNPTPQPSAARCRTSINGGKIKTPSGRSAFVPMFPEARWAPRPGFAFPPRRGRAVHQAFRRPEHRVEQGVRRFRVPNRAVFRSTRRARRRSNENRNASPAPRFPVLEGIKRRRTGQGIVFAMMPSPHTSELSGPRMRPPSTGMSTPVM